MLLTSASDTVRRSCRAGPSLTEPTTTPKPKFFRMNRISSQKFNLEGIVATINETVNQSSDKFGRFYKFGRKVPLERFDAHQFAQVMTDDAIFAANFQLQGAVEGRFMEDLQVCSRRQP